MVKEQTFCCQELKYIIILLKYWNDKLHLNQVMPISVDINIVGSLQRLIGQNNKQKK